MIIGIDIIDLDDFQRRIISKPSLLKKIFTPDELADRRPEHLAGIFAAKEALVKVGLIRAGDWLEAEIVSLPSGQPAVPNYPQVSISISHSRTSAVAVAVLE